MYLNGDGIAGKDARGAAHHRRPLPALLQRRRAGAGHPAHASEYAAAWDVVIDTGGDADAEADARGRAGRSTSSTHSLVVLREHTEPEASPDHSVAASLSAARATAHETDASRPTGPSARATYAPQHLPAPGQPRLHAARRRAGAALPATTSASTGSTSRRCWPPSPAARTATTWSPSTTSTPSAAARRASLRCRGGRARRGLGVLVDIVPNHVGVATPSEDPWWWDVLKLGRGVRARAAPSTSTGRPATGASSSR